MASLRSADMTIDLPRRVSHAAAAWADLAEGMTKSWMWWGHGHAGHQDALPRLAAGAVLAHDQHGDHDRSHGPDLRAHVQHGDHPLSAVSDGWTGDLELCLHSDYRRLSDFPVGTEHYYAGAVAILDPRLAQRVP